MRLFPYERWVLDVPLGVEDVASRLGAVVEPRRWFQMGPKGKGPFFKGNIGAQEFHIARIISGRNSFLPLISGKFEPTATGTRVRVQFMMHPVVSAFMLVWLGFATLGAGSAIAGTVAEGKGSPVLFLIPVGFCAFGISITMVGFWPEVGRAKNAMREAWNI